MNQTKTGRPSKATELTKIALVDEYFHLVVKGNANELQYNKIALFAQKKGYELSEIDFRRKNSDTRKHIEILKSRQNEQAQALEIPAYVPWNIDILLNKKPCTNAEIRKWVLQHEEVHKALIMSSAWAIEQYESQRTEICVLKERVKNLESINQEMEENLTNTQQELVKSKGKCTVLLQHWNDIAPQTHIANIAFSQKTSENREIISLTDYIFKDVKIQDDAHVNMAKDTEIDNLIKELRKGLEADN